MLQNNPGCGGMFGSLVFRRVCPIAANPSSRASEGLGWIGLEAARFDGLIDVDAAIPSLTHHRLILLIRPPEELDLRYEGVKRQAPPPAGSIYVVPAGTPVDVRSRGGSTSLHVCLDPGLVGRVAGEAFDLDPARLRVPPLDCLDLPHLRTVMSAVDAELTAGGAGGPLAAESLANLLAVQLIRCVLAPRRPSRMPDRVLPRAKLRAVIEYIDEELDATPTLEQLAAVAHLSPYHFARLFKATTGLPPHRYVISRRVERARQLLLESDGRSLAEVALSVGFTDQSQFSNHFKRLIGATPRQFQVSAKIA